MPTKNLNLYKEIWGIGSGNFVSKCKELFSFYLKFSNYSITNQLFKAKTITKYYKLYNISGNTMFAINNIKANRKEMKVYCL